MPPVAAGVLCLLRAGAGDRGRLVLPAVSPACACASIARRRISSVSFARDGLRWNPNRAFPKPELDPALDPELVRVAGSGVEAAAGGVAGVAGAVFVLRRRDLRAAWRGVA
jgi:hypothetical protein